MSRMKDANGKLVFITDLDGTFLASPGNPDRLYQFIHAHRERIILVFATGRGVDTVKPLLQDPALPKPDYIIADVGATIFDCHRGGVVHELQSEIDARWPGGLAVRERLSDIPGLSLQAVPQERRCSYYYEESVDLARIESRATAMNCDVLISAGRYLDILPYGVNKGASARRLMRFLRMNPSHAVVAGDTMNDFSLFNAGFDGIVVGGAEPALVDRLQSMRNVFFSEAPGTDGLLEGLRRFGWVEEESPPEAAPEGAGDAELVIVYHRQPFDESRQGTKTIRSLPKSPNGIIPTLLGFFTGGMKGSWVAWSQQTTRAPEHFESHVPVSQARYPRLKCARIPLTGDDVSLFYKRFSKEAFWPVIFSFPGRLQIDHDHWNHFKEINRLFAEQAAREAAVGAFVWVHDYNLWLVPGFLRALRPDLRISFFHHTSFPPADVFNLLPWRSEIIGSLLQCDHIGFHIPRYVENFIDATRSSFPIEVLEREAAAPRFLTYGCASGIDHFTSRIRSGSREIALGSHPVGIDLQRIRAIAESPTAREQAARLREEFQGRRIILSVERLDYVKGPLEKVLAFERYLEAHPESHGKVVLLNIVTPPAPGMEVYKATREKLDQLVGRVNGRFASLDWTPIRYLYRSFPFEELIPLYIAADVAWITPLRDGLNLVCKEFVAAKDVAGKPGVLILSEFAGAAVELHGALLVNPYDPAGMVESLHQALTLPAEDVAARMRLMTSIVRTHDVQRWARDYFSVMGGGFDEAAE